MKRLTKVKIKGKKMSNAMTLLESLQTYGYKEREVTIGEIKVILASLTGGEIIEIFETCSTYADLDAAMQALKIETLARGIIRINEYKFDPSIVTTQKRDIIMKFGDDLIELLFEEYCNIDESVKKTIEKLNKIKAE